MGHAVFHRTASGEAQLEDVSSLEAALELVERLRNEEGPTDVRLFKEIPVEVRTYYRVVAAEDGEPTGEMLEETTAEVVDSEPAEDEPVASADDAPTDDASTDDSEDDGDKLAETEDVEVAEDEAPAPSASVPTEPPAGAMPLLSPPPPTVTVHSEDEEPATASSGGGRPKLFNRG